MSTTSIQLPFPTSHTFIVGIDQYTHDNGRIAHLTEHRQSNPVPIVVYEVRILQKKIAW